MKHAIGNGAVDRGEKVRLKIDELRLQSFNTSDNPSQHRGTVNGYENPTNDVDCAAFDTCALSCACNLEDCTAICQSDACTQERVYGTYIGSGG